MNEPTPNDHTGTDTKPPFSSVLKQSDSGTLKLIGSLMDYFGVKTVVAFFLGLAATYMYAAILGPPPYFPKTSGSAAGSSMIRLSGVVHTIENKPLAEFNIGLMDKFVPVTNPNGTFQLEVPQRAQYDLIVGDPRVGTFYLFGSQFAEKKGPGEYELSAPLGNFPMELGAVIGSAFDRNNKPIKGTVEVEGKTAKIDDDGYFKLVNIPMGRTKIRVTPADASQQSWEQDIQVSTTGSTAFDVTVPK